MPGLILGELAGDGGVLNEAVATYRDLLKERSRERAPLEWAMTQNNLGDVLVSLGKRERGTEEFAEAVTALSRRVGRIYCRRSALGWAVAQNNLGYALESMGKRDGDPCIWQKLWKLIGRR